MSQGPTVLELQARGSRTPFFAINVPGMNPRFFALLAENLGEDRPFYSIQNPGPRIVTRPYTPLEYEKMAADYIQGMKTVQPRGPYHFAGVCEGARIAFDMARLLEKQGEETALLGIFDTWALENTQIRALWKIDYYIHRAKRLWSFPVAKKREWLLKKWQKKSLVAKAGGGPNNAGDAGGRGQLTWPQAYWPGEDFVPATFGGNITLFKRPKQGYQFVRDPLMGWGTRTTAEVELRVINPSPKRHVLLFREPYVRHLAELLRESLDAVEGKRRADSPGAPAGNVPRGTVR
jgi:thioesterase domain-containing protein